MDRKWIKALGPGILFASTAIGVSHLVQSTRSGAVYGLGLLWAVIAANVLKYPFFEFGSRYAGAVGKSLIEGYARLGKGVLWLYAFITLCSMFFVSAAVTAVTAGFMDQLFGLSASWEIKSPMISFGLLLISALILGRGRYNFLDRLIKVVAFVLLISTLLAFFLSLSHGPVSVDMPIAQSFDLDTKGWAFLIALMGWMPTAVDLSTWNSLWTLEKMKSENMSLRLRDVLLDFNVGYVMSATLALCFVVMGAFLLYGSEEVLSTKSAAFAGQVIGLYTQTIGAWSYPIMASAGFAIMFGTCIAVLDGYARTMTAVLALMRKPGMESGPSKKPYPFFLGLLVLGSFLIVWQFGQSLPSLVDLATTISFLIAPLIALANFVLVLPPYVSLESAPPFWLRCLAFLGLIYLFGFSLFYLLL